MAGTAHDQVPAHLEPLFMRRPTLDRLPPLPSLPPEYAARRYLPGDHAPLALLLSNAYGFQWDDDRVRRALTEASDVPAIFVVTRDDRAAATASARVAPDQYPGSGCLHWVAVDPLAQSAGLGRYVCLQVMGYCREQGLRDAVLETNDFRLAAIRSYLRLGFVPEYRDQRDQVRWMTIMPKLFW